MSGMDLPAVKNESICQHKEAIELLKEDEPGDEGLTGVMVMCEECAALLSKTDGEITVEYDPFADMEITK